MNLKFNVIGEDFVPKKSTENASAYDVYAYLPDGDLVINPIHFTNQKSQSVLIPLGFSVDMRYNKFYYLKDGNLDDDSVEFQLSATILPRSGYALNNKISTHIGTIDNDYLKQVGVILYNYGAEQFVVKHKQKIAQIKFELLPVFNEVLYNIVDNIDDLNKGDRGGFGSTGII